MFSIERNTAGKVTAINFKAKSFGILFMFVFWAFLFMVYLTIWILALLLIPIATFVDVVERIFTRKRRW